MATVRVSAVALPIEIGDVAANLAALREALTRAEPGPHLIVFTELATSGYVFADIDEARELSLEADDPRLTGLATAVPDGRLGVAICYDNEFPEVPRRLALAGAELLALPVNWPLVSRPVGERPPEVVIAMAAARSSRLPTVITDRHGSERGVEWTGGTAVVSGDGWVCSTPDVRGVASALITTTTDKAVGPHNDLFADRRLDLYSPALPVPTS